LDAFPGGLGDTVLDGLSAEMLFSSEDILDEMLRGLVQTKFVPYSYKREVTYEKNHEAIYEAIRENNKSKQDDAHSKLVYKLCDRGLDNLLHDSTGARVKVKVGGQYVSAGTTCVALCFYIACRYARTSIASHRPCCICLVAAASRLNFPRMSLAMTSAMMTMMAVMMTAISMTMLASSGPTFPSRICIWRKRRMLARGVDASR
jgi:hypothetical protein